MTTTTTDDLPEVQPALEAEPVTPDEPAARATLTLGEVSALGAVLAGGCTGGVSLALAQVGQHDGWLSVALGVGLAAALAGGAIAFGGRPSIRVDKVEIGLVAATVLAAGFLFLPGFPYAYADKDPGVYVAHGFAIAREADVAIPNEVVEAGLNTPTTWAGAFPGVYPAYEKATASTSQFFHYTSALMATAADLGGRRGLFNLTPLLAILSVVVLVLTARRAAGTRTAVILAPLLVLCMLQVWQARYPSTEIPAQLFLAAAVLGGVLAMDQRWAGGAFIAGILVGLGFVVRPDGFLYIALAAGVSAVVIALGRADRRLVALWVGVALTLPGAYWNAYELRAPYSEVNGVPSAAKLAAACFGLVALGAVAHRVWRWRSDVDALSVLVRWQRPLGLVLTGLFGLVLVALWNRETLFGQSQSFSVFTKTVERDLNEFNLIWLALFISIPGLVLMWLGGGVALLGRHKPALYLLLLPGTLLLPLYLWDARVSMRMMWWGRRFVPAVVPAILLLIALTLTWALWHRHRALRAAGLVALLGVLAWFGRQSLPLREHREMGGSWDLAAAVAAPAGDEEGVFLFGPPDSGNLFDPLRNVPTAVWWIHGQTSAWLPADYDMATIETYQQAFPERPLFLVVHDAVPDSLPADRFEVAGMLQNELLHWEEWPWGVPPEGAAAHRPRTQLRSPQRLVIWRVLG